MKLIYSSIFATYIENFLAKKTQMNKRSLTRYQSVMISFDQLILDKKIEVLALTPEIIEDWVDTYGFTEYRRKTAHMVVKQFANYLLEQGIPSFFIAQKEKSEKTKENRSQYCFQSVFAEDIRQLVESKRAQGYDYGTVNEFGLLCRFDKLCIALDVKERTLTSEIIRSWMDSALREGQKSKSNRLTLIKQLAISMNQNGITSYIPEIFPPPKPPFPYIPDESELQQLFKAIDVGKTKYPWSKLVVSVLLRLLFCTGMRISEACSLRCEDVKTNILSEVKIEIFVTHAKGHKSRMIYLKGDMADLLITFQNEISVMIPNRRWYFPSAEHPESEFIPTCYIRKKFNQAWQNTHRATEGLTRKPSVHTLRHAFVIYTLRRWRIEQKDINSMILYLSKYLGHNTIRETYYYYNHFDKDFEEVTKDTNHFNAMVPEANYGN